MPTATIPLTSFTGGEWSPRLHGRVDIQKYNTACEVLKNMVIYPHGGATRRMGMEYIADAKTNNVRLIPFEYNREQAYVLEFGGGYIRFYRNGAQLLETNGLPKELFSPFAASDLPGISFAQSGDVLYLVHENFHPRKITRTGADTFGIDFVPFVSPPTAWAASNYPRAAVFFQGRLVFAGTPKQAQTAWFSKVNLYENFDKVADTTGNQALEVTLAANQANSIQWLVPGKKLFVGTTGGEWTISGAGDAPMTGSNIRADRESNFGSSSGHVQLVGNGVIYPSRDGKKLREMAYRYESDGFDSPELSLLSEHLTRPGIKEFDFAQNPDGILWVVLNDGTFAGLTYLKSQEVQGWHRHQTDGVVLSVATIEGPNYTETWFAVLRNGKTRIELMPPAFEGISADSVECTYLDSYLTYSGVPVSNISGLAHLNGKEVSILADGQYLSDKIVVNGSITLEVKASRVVVGLPYEWKLRPLRLEGGSPNGFSQGKMKSVDSVIVRVERSAGIKHQLPGEIDPMPVPDRNFGDNMNEAIDLFTGDIEIKLHPSWNRRGQFELVGDSPFPVTILMLSAKVSVYE